TVAVGNVDAHATAAAANTLQSGQMVAIMGTSTCHIMNWDRLVEIPGICGVVWEGVVPGMWGYEAGQSGVGDIFRWFVETHLPSEYHAAAERQNLSPYDYLASLAARKPAGSNGLVALDWHNGNRSVLVDHELSGVLVGLTLSTRPEDVYRAYVEATAFGMKVILDTFAEYGLGVRELVAAGGLSKEPFIMQIYADVLDMPISILETTNGSALGAAIHAAVAAGEYPNIYEAAEAMNKTRRDVYRPRPTEAAVYRERYHDYLLLHDYFGREKREVLRALRRARHVVDVSRDRQ
ncbi:MAG: ribulokinase, partial [Acidothermus sp.]|nr:ribulokinase [Acidothermus sp.]